MNYFRYVIAILTPVILMVTACMLFLYRGGELSGLETIAKAQQQFGGIYGTAVHADTYAYKFALLRARRPEVAILGSSRVLTFRQEFFTPSFANMGLVASSAEQMERAVRELLQTYRPRVVILGIDHYWGNPAWNKSLEPRGAGNTSHVIPNVLLPAQWLLDKKITPRELLSGLIGTPPSASGSPYAWGWSALKHGDGFAADGSYVYGSAIFGRSPAADPQFRDILRRVVGGTSQFVHGNTVSESAVGAITRSVELLRDANIRTIILIPPVALVVHREIARQTRNYGYIHPFLERIMQPGVRQFNMLDPTAFGGEACEFVDGFHVGDVGAARILKLMGAALGAGTLNERKIEAALHARAGHASLDDRFARPDEREKDFLALGCAR